MSKRPFPWEDDYQRQFKTHVNDQRVRGNNASHMNDIFGARRAATQPPMPQDGLPGSSDQSPGLVNVIDDMDQMEMDDYETYEMPVAPGSAVGSVDEVEMKPLPDLIQGPSTSSPFSGDNFTEATIEDPPEASCRDIDPVWPRMLRTPCSGNSGNSLTEGTVEDFPEASSRDSNQAWPRMSRRHSRLDRLRNMEKRDPSPVPSTQNLLTSFINTTRRTHGPFSDAEKETLMQQAKTYRQLNIDSFVRNRDTRGNSNENRTESNKDYKDINDNKEMEF